MKNICFTDLLEMRGIKIIDMVLNEERIWIEDKKNDCGKLEIKAKFNYENKILNPEEFYTPKNPSTKNNLRRYKLIGGLLFEIVADNWDDHFAKFGYNTIK